MAALRSTLAVATAALVVALGSGGCTRKRPRAAAPKAAAPGDDITFYRDAAVIRQRVELDLPATPTTVKVELAAGINADQIMILDRGGLSITGVHAKTKAPAERDPDDPDDDEDDGERDVDDAEPYDPDAPSDPCAGGATDDPPPPAGGVPRPVLHSGVRPAPKPTELRLDVVAPRAGKYAVTVAYVTNRLRWDVAYTLTASPTRDRGDLRGALAIRNDTGIELRPVRSRVVDAELVAWRGKTAEHLAADLVGGTHGSTAPATPRELGGMQLRDGETRVELVRDTSRRLRSVLVYDPIGTKLDNPGATPLRDPALGTKPAAAPTVTESFEVARDERGTAGLPAGPVRLLAREQDGSVSVLGESRLFEASTRVSDVDTIAVGTAVDVVGSRERREITIDDEHDRLVEEFVITLDNKRAHPVEVLVREHLYRGQNWTLAYHSAPEAAKEGPQQISLRTKVPAKSKSKLLYVVVYTWGQ